MAARPGFWAGLWERYVESQVDYRASADTVGRKLGEAGADAWQLLEWVRGVAGGAWAQGVQVPLLARVFGEQFTVVGGQPTPLAQEKEVIEAKTPATPPPAAPAGGGRARSPRRQEQQTEAFQQRMKQRNGIEGTQSELVRATDTC